MASGYCQDHPILRELPMGQILVPRRETGDKAGIQPSREYRVNLVNRKLMMQLQRHVRLPGPEGTKGVYHNPVPGKRRRNSYPQGSAFALRYLLGAKLGTLDFLQNASGVLQEQLPRGVQFDPTRQSLEKGKSKLPFQILYLP